MIAYCDFIADRIRNSLLTSAANVQEPVRLTKISKVEYDVGPMGEFNSTKKTIFLYDGFGKEYRVTIEEV